MRKLWFTLSLLISLMFVTAVPAVAVTPDEDPDRSAAAWLVSQYEDRPDTFGFGGGAGDIADLIFALAGAGVGRDVATTTLLPALESMADPYVSSSTGALAKTILAVVTAGGDPTSFAGQDLRSLLDDAYDAATGRFADNAFDQALAILAWAAIHDTVPTEAADFLLVLACGDGGYAYACDWGADADTTALAAQALLAAGADASGPVAWLLEQQKDDGSFHSFGVASPNSTGLAAMALRAAGDTQAAEAAADWMLTQQAGCDSEDAGSIGDPDVVFSVESATMQGLLAFGAPRYDELDVTTASSEVPVVCDLVLEPVTDTSGDDTGGDDTGGGTALPSTDVDDTADELADTGWNNAWLVLVAGLLVLAGVGLLRVPVRDQR